MPTTESDKMSARSPTPPLKKMTKVISQAGSNVTGVVKRVEVHKDAFDTEEERNDAIFGYAIVFSVNALSCVSLLLFFLGWLTPLGEIDCELAFLILKGIIEAATGKLSVPLIFHHSIMIIGFVAVQYSWAVCYVWIVVHAQLVHIPFALRSLWRLMMPQLRLLSPQTQWMREIIDGAFWVTWMGLCGYRSLLIGIYSFWAVLNVDLSKGLLCLTCSCAIGLAFLDKAWTTAMWPKPKFESPMFLTGVRLFFTLGVIASVTVFGMDVYPEFFGKWENSALATRVCLANQLKVRGTTV